MRATGGAPVHASKQRSWCDFGGQHERGLNSSGDVPELARF